MNEKVTAYIRTILSDEQGIKSDRILPSSELRNDLGLRQFDIINLCMALEEKYKVTITDEDMESVKTVSDLAQVTEMLVTKHAAPPTQPKS